MRRRLKSCLPLRGRCRRRRQRGNLRRQPPGLNSFTSILSLKNPSQAFSWEISRLVAAVAILGSSVIPPLATARDDGGSVVSDSAAKTRTGFRSGGTGPLKAPSDRTASDHLSAPQANQPSWQLGANS